MAQKELQTPLAVVLFVIVAGLIVATSWRFGATHEAVSESLRTPELEKVGAALFKWAREHDGVYPPDLATLLQADPSLDAAYMAKLQYLAAGKKGASLTSNTTILIQPTGTLPHHPHVVRMWNDGRVQFGTPTNAP